MRSQRTSVFFLGVAAIGIYAATNSSHEKEPSANTPVSTAVNKGIKWLVSVQGDDGGWGQDGGETEYGHKRDERGNRHRGNACGPDPA